MTSQADKYDDEKPRWDLLPLDAIEGCVRVLTAGSHKYDDHNWRRGHKFSRLVAACFRHLVAIAQGDDVDPEFGELHTSHLLCEIAFLDEHIRHGLGDDDRWRYPSTTTLDAIEECASGAAKKVGSVDELLCECRRDEQPAQRLTCKIDPIRSDLCSDLYVSSGAKSTYKSTEYGAILQTDQSIDQVICPQDKK